MKKTKYRILNSVSILLALIIMTTQQPALIGALIFPYIILMIAFISKDTDQQLDIPIIILSIVILPLAPIFLAIKLRNKYYYPRGKRK